MNIVKSFWANLSHLPSSGAAVVTIIAWYLNTKCGFIPKEVADAILIIVQAAVLTVFVRGNTEVK